MYLNKVYLGENTVGVEQAALRYFGVNLARGQTLTLDQAALLAGLPQAPSAYDPILHPQAALRRRNIVLQNMVKYGYITQQQASAAEKQPLDVKYHALPAILGTLTHFSRIFCSIMPRDTESLPSSSCREV